MSHPSPISEDRPLTVEEHGLVQWLLMHGKPQARDYLPQLSHARVVERCACGCASVNFEVAGRRPSPDAPMQNLADLFWKDTSGRFFGVFLFDCGGVLAGLEVWSIDGLATPTTLPAVENLQPHSERFVNDVDERNLDEYLALIDKKLEAAGRKDWSCLSDAERTTLTAYFFALDVTNGGMEKFFLYRGDRWRETLQAIKAVGATRLAALFDQALAAFPGRVPSSDEATRYNQLMAAGALGEGLLWKLTGEYYQLQATSAEHCLYQRLTAFAIKQLAILNGP